MTDNLAPDEKRVLTILVNFHRPTDTSPRGADGSRLESPGGRKIEKHGWVQELQLAADVGFDVAAGKVLGAEFHDILSALARWQYVQVQMWDVHGGVKRYVKPTEKAIAVVEELDEQVKEASFGEMVSTQAQAGTSWTRTPITFLLGVVAGVIGTLLSRSCP